MMELKWTGKALSDLVRLYDFLAPVNKQAAARIVQSLTAAPAHLKEYPRIGEKLEEFEPREVRRILVNHYKMRYEIRECKMTNNCHRRETEKTTFNLKRRDKRVFSIH